MKRIFAFFLCLLLTTSAVYAYPSPTREFYVNDYANVLSESTEQFITVQGEYAEKNHDGLQVVVLTVENMEGEDKDSYALNIGRQWGIGSEDKDNGILIVLALEERKIKLEVGYGLEGNINDAKSGRLLDNYAMPYLIDNDFDSGILNLYKAVMETLNVEIVDRSVAYAYQNTDTENNRNTMPALIGICILVTLYFIFCNGFTPASRYRRHQLFMILKMLLRNSHRGGGSGGFGGGNFGGGGSFGGGGASRKF